MKRLISASFIAILIALLASCASAPKKTPPKNMGQQDTSGDESVPPPDDGGAFGGGDDFSNEAPMDAESLKELYESVLKKKERIDTDDYAHFDQKNYDKGAALLAEIAPMMADIDHADMRKLTGKVKSADGAFTAVLFKAFLKQAKEARAAALKEKKRADGVKAQVAAKEDYRVAADEFMLGDSLLSMQNSEGAFNHYKSVREQFAKIADVVTQKREEVRVKLEAAKKSVDESRAYAEAADKSKPLTDKIEGIEEEGTTLLEADEYDSAEGAAADIPDDIATPGDDDDEGGWIGGGNNE